MKKFVFLYVGFEPLTQESMQTWGAWIGSIGDKMVDSGNPFSGGIEISHSGTHELPLDKNALTGYSIINARDIEEAETLASGCPMITSVRVYEAVAM